MKPRTSQLGPGLTAFALLALATNAAQAQVVAKKCNPPPAAVAFKAAMGLKSTMSTSFVTISQTTINFTQGGSKPGCVIVYFSGLGGARSTSLQIRATIDGAAGLPSSTRWSGDDDENNNSVFLRSRGINFVFPSVAPGPHTLRMQWHSFSGDVVQLNDHNTIVHHVP